MTGDPDRPAASRGNVLLWDLDPVFTFVAGAAPATLAVTLLGASQRA